MRPVESPPKGWAGVRVRDAISIGSIVAGLVALLVIQNFVVSHELTSWITISAAFVGGAASFGLLKHKLRR